MNNALLESNNKISLLSIFKREALVNSINCAIAYTV